MTNYLIELRTGELNTRAVEAGASFGTLLVAFEAKLGIATERAVASGVAEHSQVVDRKSGEIVAFGTVGITGRGSFDISLDSNVITVGDNVVFNMTAFEMGART
ncbi:MAG: hypothetical protein V4696_03835 [Pseudomonadota bacterium]